MAKRRFSSPQNNGDSDSRTLGLSDETLRGLPCLGELPQAEFDEFKAARLKEMDELNAALVYMYQ